MGNVYDPLETLSYLIQGVSFGKILKKICMGLGAMKTKIRAIYTSKLKYNLFKFFIKVQLRLPWWTRGGGALVLSVCCGLGQLDFLDGCGLVQVGWWVDD